MEKVFWDEEPKRLENGFTLSTFQGNKAAVQLVYYCPANGAPGRTLQQFEVKVDGAPADVRLRRVENMPVHMACYENADDDYLRKTPGLYPDRLEDTDSTTFYPYAGQYRSLWITFEVPQDAQTGDYPVTVRVNYPAKNMIWYGLIEDVPEDEQTVTEFCFTMHIAEALPELTTIHTEWFYADCLADYYNVPVFSDEFWRITENFLRSAREHNVNSILTPVFTPALDTYVGGERTTVQLVDVKVNAGGRYTFATGNLEKWLEICKRLGFLYIELPPFFTQWGAKATPKVVADVNGREEKIFGWHVASNDPAYMEFLTEFVPVVIETIGRFGYGRENIIRHTSDEPPAEFRDTFLKAQKLINELLDGCIRVDQNQVHANDIPGVPEAEWPDTLVYYCCVQGHEGVPNRFFSMPSYRNRAIGILLYLYGFKGFLQWGFNFYNAGHSFYRIDPFRVADGDCAWPAGDPFLVYPASEGTAISSIRAEVQDDAFTDLRMLQKLESRIGRDSVVKLIYEDSGLEKIDINNYPRNSEYYLQLREKMCEKNTWGRS